MDTVTIRATRRESKNKGPARRMRREGKIPAVAYGRSLAAMHLTVSPKELRSVLEGPYGKNAIIELDVEGAEKLRVLIKDYQYHPVSRELLHADFFQFEPGNPVDVTVPFELVGRAKGVAMGGMLRKVMRRIPVRAVPDKIPAKLVHDVSNVGMDETVNIGDLELPEGVTATLDARQTVAIIVPPKKKAAADEAEAEPDAEEKKA